MVVTKASYDSHKHAVWCVNHMSQASRHPLSARTSRHIAPAAWLLVASAICGTICPQAEAAHELFAQAEPSTALKTIEPAPAAPSAGKLGEPTKQVAPPPPAEPAPESGPGELIGGQAGANSPSFNRSDRRGSPLAVRSALVLAKGMNDPVRPQSAGSR